MPRWLLRLFNCLFSGMIYLILVAALAAVGLFATQIKHFRLDASSDSLVLENDQSIDVYREIKKKFGSDDFLFVTFSPGDSVLTQKNLELLKNLQSQFEQIKGIDSVTSIFTVPLFNVDDIDLTNFGEKAYYLKPDGDLAKAKEGLTTNPLYKNLLINVDATTTALVLYMVQTPRLREIQKLLSDENASLPPKELAALKVEKRELMKTIDQNTRRVIAEVRAILKPHKSNIEAYIGGVPMIASDMIAYVENDLTVFGVSVLAFIVAVLTLIFRQVLWVAIPLVCCFLTIIVTTSFLGYMRWPVTVISSNFVSLLLIMTMSITIHLVVRYQELIKLNPEQSNKSLLLHTLNSMFLPCLYTSLTTMVAFGSLITSDIRPVIDFGKMMIIGVGFSFVIAFFMLPIFAFVLIKKPSQPKKQLSFQKLTELLAKFTDNFRFTIGLVATTILVFSVSGLFHLSVDNRFIDYFKESTEIHQGMKVIDQKLGGTTPLDVVIKKSAVKIETFDDFDYDSPAEAEGEEFATEEFATEEFATEEFATEEFATEEFATEEFATEDFADSGDTAAVDDGIFKPSVWFTPEGRAVIAKIHDKIDSLPETGKVLSLWTTFQLIELLNSGEPLDDFELSVLQKNFPDDLRGQLLTPYFHLDSEDAALGIRIIESEKNLKRSELIDKIDGFLQGEMGLSPDQYQLSGMLILYNNMLASLFDSQIKTLGTVFGVIMLMFIVLFRSLKLAIIGIVPNMLSALFILGSMGWFGIPLDMMTITIAAITIGIAVDNTIHYIYRFKSVFPEEKNYIKTMYQCHGSIGKAMYYTSMTIIFGFSILVLSNFIPSIYFGLFTSLAMFVALLANLTLLPLMLVKTKPLGAEN